MVDLEYKTFSASEIKAVDKKAGVLEAIVSVFNNVDMGNDKILPGFFSKSLRQKLPKGVWMHDWAQPIAKTIAAEELRPGDPRLPDSIRTLGGLYIKGQFNLDTQRGREAFSDIDFGTIDEFSIGYVTQESTTDSKTGVRTLIEGQLFEWSPVLLGMNRSTIMLGTKAGPKGQPPMPDVKDMTEGDDSAGGATVPEETKSGMKPGMHVKWDDRKPETKAGCGTIKAIHTKGTHGGHEATEKDPVARLALCRKDDEEGMESMSAVEGETKCHECKCMATKTMVHHPVKHLKPADGTPIPMDDDDGDEKSFTAQMAEANAEITRLKAELATKAHPAHPELKGPYLGDTDESMTAAALDRLHSMLGWYLFACVRSDKPLADVLTAASGAIDEYKATCLKLFSALLEDETGEDEITPEVAPPYGYGYGYGSMDHRVLTTKYLAKLASLDTSRDRVVTTLSLEDRSHAVVSALGEIRDLGKRFADVRHKEGRVLSGATRGRLQAVLDALNPLATDLKALLDESAPKPKEEDAVATDTAATSDTKAILDPAALLRARAEYAQFDYLLQTSGV